MEKEMLMEKKITNFDRALIYVDVDIDMFV